MKNDRRVYLFLFKQQWFCSQWDQPKYKKYVQKELWLLADRRMDNMFCPTLTAAHCLFNLCNSGDAEAHHEETLRCVCDNAAHVLSSLSTAVCFTCGCALVSIMMVWLDQYNQLTKISNSTNNQNQIPTKSLAKWTRDIVDNVRSQDGRICRLDQQKRAWITTKWLLASHYQVSGLQFSTTPVSSAE